MCKEANIGWRSRADILKALNKISEYDKPSASQVIILHPKEHEKMNQIYEQFKQVSQKIGFVESQIIELEENSKKAEQGISEACESIITAVETHQEYLFETIDTYKKKKKELLDKFLKQLKEVQQQFKIKNEQITECINGPNIDINEKREKLQQLLRDEVHKNIGGSVWNDNEKEADACINVQFANEKKEIDELVEMIDQLLKQQMIIVESGSITLSSVKVKGESKISDNPLVSVNYSIEDIGKGLKDLQQWNIIKQIPGKKDSSDGTIDFGDEKDNLLEWGEEYSLRMR
ncbi:hypothetical protein RFI_28161, partial [Reticulomyxa filosa]